MSNETSIIAEGASTPLESGTPVDHSPFPIFHDWMATFGSHPSPAPTVTSSLDMHGIGPTSGYNSEYGDVDIDGCAETEDEDMADANEVSLTVSPDYSDSLASSRYRESIRTQVHGRAEESKTSHFHEQEQTLE